MTGAIQPNLPATSPTGVATPLDAAMFLLAGTAALVAGTTQMDKDKGKKK